MKKTLKFDDGSVMVGSSSTFTVTQEDQGDIDIFDMPSKYIWLSNRDTLDGADDYQGDTIYIGIYLRAGSKRYKLTVEDLQPFKYENIKCKVIERTDTEDAVLKLTNTDGSIGYYFDSNCLYNSNVQKIEALKELNNVNIGNCSSLTDVNLMGNITTRLLVRNCNKLTKIACDRPIKPNSISITNNPELLSVPEFKSGVYNNMKNAFTGCPKLNIDTSVFQLSGDCSEAFYKTGITRLVINDAGITSMFRIADAGAFLTKTLQEVVINGTLNKCKDYAFAFKGNTGLNKCDMSGVNFENVFRLSGIFQYCKQLTTVGINYATIGNSLNDVSFMFDQSGITDDIIFSNSALRFSNIYNLCSPQTKKLVFANNSILGEQDINNAIKGAINLEYLEIPNYGSNQEQKQLNLIANTKLGTGSEENLQAFKNIFINAFDRKTAGYAVCTVSLAATQKALLTAEEITAFENKGYKIA